MKIIWNSSVFIKLYWNRATCIIYVYGSLQVTLAGWEAASETIWPSQPEIFTVWFFREQVCQLCATDSFFIGYLSAKTCSDVLAHSRDIYQGLDTGIEDEHDAFPVRRDSQPRGEHGMSTGNCSIDLCVMPKCEFGAVGTQRGSPDSSWGGRKKGGHH